MIAGEVLVRRGSASDRKLNKNWSSKVSLSTLRKELPLPSYPLLCHQRRTSKITDTLLSKCWIEFSRNTAQTQIRGRLS